MKTPILSAALALTLGLSLATPAAFAQAAVPQASAQQAPDAGRGHRHAPDPHKQAVKMGRKLGLNPDQTAKLEPILADRQQKVQQLRENTALTEDQRHDQMRTIQQATRQQMSDILTPDQMKQLKMQRRDRGQQTGAGAPSGV